MKTYLPLTVKVHQRCPLWDRTVIAEVYVGGFLRAEYEPVADRVWPWRIPQPPPSSEEPPHHPNCRCWRPSGDSV